MKTPGTQKTVPTVTCLGEILIDFVAETTGSLLSVSRFRKFPGGAPANVAVGLARLGIHCGFIGKIGDDAFGNFLQKTLQDNNVNTGGLTRTRQAPTALAFVARSSTGEPDFHFYRQPCADILLTKADLPITWLQGTRILHVGSVSLTQEPSRQATIHAVKVAKAHSATISFDPNLRLDLWDKGLDDCYRMMHTLLKDTDIFLPSIEELLLIMDTNDLDEAVSKVLEIGPHTLCIKCGSKGAVGFQKTETGKTEMIKKSAFSVDVVDTTGAGDGFDAGFIAAMVEGLSLNRAIHQGNAVAALAITKKGAMTALPSRRQLERFLGKTTDLD